MRAATDIMLHRAVPQPVYAAFRLAGAGWGGCVVALLPAAGAPAFMQQVAQQFYEPAVAAGKLAREQLQACLFMTVPARGAEVALL